jgi:phospholipid/cholesterol/gamma-HCH transport system substrate-binding protein
LGRVTDVLVKNQQGLDRTLALAGPYYRLVGNTLGNGRWFDTYLCGLVPRNYLPTGSLPGTGCMPPKNGGYS